MTGAKERVSPSAPKPAQLDEGGDITALLVAPATPVGREAELNAMAAAVDAVAAGECRVMLVAGCAGVGKSSLMQQLRPMAQARGGRFVTGKFEQQGVHEAAAIVQALGALGRLLLAESAPDRVQVRSSVLRVLGTQAGLARVMPEFALLLFDVPEARAIDPAHAAARMVEVVAGLLRAIASPAQPLVLVLDDLQWSGALSTRLIESVLDARDIRGLLLVAAYRDNELAPDHPLAVSMARRAGDGRGAQLLQVANLAHAQAARLLAATLAVPEAAALRLARTLEPYTGGNPFDTVELLNALRDDGLLAPADAGPQWDDAAVARHLAGNSVRAVLAARIAGLPPQARELLQSLACIGAQISREMARAVAAMAPGEFEGAIGVLRERGFLARDALADGIVKMRHDHVQQAALESLAQPQRGERHLQLARRLAGQGGFAPFAADQYVLAVDRVMEAAEAARAAQLLRETAAQARLTGNHVAACRMQEAALRLLERTQAAALAACEIEYHVALYSTGRLQEADAMYSRIAARHAVALDYVDATCAQLGCLMNDRMDEAVALGVRMLREFGLNVPQDFTPGAEFPAKFARARRWVESFDLARETARPQATLPWVVASAKVISRLVSVAVLKDPRLLIWLIFQSQELWEEHGPCAPLVASFGQASFVTIAIKQDWRTGYLAIRQALDLCEARGWEPETSLLRCVYCLSAIQWFEPLERRLTEAERSREGLLANGDLRNAAYACQQSAAALFECGPTLHRHSQELEAALALSRRAENHQAFSRCVKDRQLLRALQGQGDYSAAFDNYASDDERALVNSPANTWVTWYDASGRAMAAAIFGDVKALSQHARVSMAHRLAYQSFYSIVWSFWLSGLAAALELQADAQAGEQKDARLAEIDTSIEWLRQRAIDAPLNFRHLHLHLLGERAWAKGELDAAGRLFDEALGAAEQTARPGQRALITERAARLNLAQDLKHAGSQLLREAQRLYAAWGATAKLAQLEAETGVAAFLAVEEADAQALLKNPLGRGIDTLAVLRASQALSTERSPARLLTMVQDVLERVTGATRVVVASWSEAAADWMLRDAGGMQEDGAVSLQAAAHLVPLTAVRYAERTREPLLVHDALADDRFGRDVYFQGVERCSLMVAPVLHRGVMQTMLVLENRTRRAAFDRQRLDAAMMIAAQLAVSLESAMLYETLERKVREQTQLLQETQSRLVQEARRSGMVQIATSVLHNVGNVLTSVNVSTHMLESQVRQSRGLRVTDLVQLIDDNARDFRRFFLPGEKGALLPGYMRELARALQDERELLMVELGRLRASVDHIKSVVAMQQSYAGKGGVLEISSFTDLMDDALRIQRDVLAMHGVTVVRDFGAVPPVALDRNRIMQVLVDLIENALLAMEGVPGERVLCMKVTGEDGMLRASVKDTGIGLAPDDLRHVFSDRLTTRPGESGFGLHSSAIAAREMGGELTAHSDGPGTGSTFRLELPLVQRSEETVPADL